MISLVQTVTGGTYAGNLTVNISPTNGNALVCALLFNQSNFTSLRDNNGIDFTQATSGASGGGDEYIYHLFNVNSVTSVTLTVSAISFPAMVLSEVSGISALGGASTSNAYGVGPTWTSPALSIINSNAIIFGAVGTVQGGEDFGATSPWLLAGTEQEGGTSASGLVYQIVSSTGTYTPTGTGTSFAYKSCTAAYLAAASSSVRPLLTLGVGK